MFSTKCPNCKQVVSLKPEEVQQAVSEVEAAKHSFYSLPCPHCRKAIKIPLRDLKAKLPPKPVEAPKPEQT